MILEGRLAGRWMVSKSLTERAFVFFRSFALRFWTARKAFWCSLQAFLASSFLAFSIRIWASRSYKERDPN